MAATQADAVREQAWRETSKSLRQSRWRQGHTGLSEISRLRGFEHHPLCQPHLHHHGASAYLVERRLRREPYNREGFDGDVSPKLDGIRDELSVGRPVRKNEIHEPAISVSGVSTDAPPTRAPQASACAPYRDRIVAALALGRNAMAIPFRDWLATLDRTTRARCRRASSASSQATWATTRASGAVCLRPG